MKHIAILGSTGSIGSNALSIIEANPEKFKVHALAAGSNIKKLASQIEKHKPRLASVADAKKAKELRRIISGKTKVVHGVEGAMEVAADYGSDMVLSAMVGAIGLEPTVAAIKAGKNIALANKETIVTAGEIVIKEARLKRVKIIPVDSEHSAIFQALRGEKHKNIKKIILTASGGPFLKHPKNRMDNISIKDALNHPNWKMGKKITIDSATMMNKGLEVIEARWLFNLPAEKIEVVIHQQSIIHSMVEFCDSSLIAQLGLPDMRTPIAFALGYPDRLKLDLKSLSLPQMKKLTFAEPDTKKFPCLALAYEALKLGGSTPCVLNAANEIAVNAFLNGKIKFTDIPRVIEKTIETTGTALMKSFTDAIDCDRQARVYASEVAKKIKR
ncbi:1-deoxy-D-xylulose 5-phosphate reductoisomerase [hydrothermal vent metagenome]|uniref:1-deoxy-D-xylulose-5-phosphate reductoisomerase n=1 Tax=hydrothermal vent metagenome TaxID=652676 RepID=A0A3B1BJ24_9ZZZZ